MASFHQSITVGRRVHLVFSSEELLLLIGASEMFSIARVIVSVDAWRLERLLVSQAR